MKDISIVEYSKDYFEIWNSFVAKAKNATFLFDRNFMDYHADRFEDNSLLVFQNNRLIALFPANRDDRIIHSHQGLSYGGLVIENKLKFEVIADCFKSILIYLKNTGTHDIYLKQIPSIYSTQPNNEMDYLMKILKAELNQRQILSVIDLGENFKINSNRLEGKKRGIKNNLKIVEEADFEEFWNKILIPNLNFKHNVNPVHNLSEIIMLHDRFPNNIRQFNVYRDNEIVAGTTLFETDNVVHAQYISGNLDNNVLGSLDFLYCYLIEDRFKNKKYFDFGTSNLNDGKNINKGLLFWKEGFGARSAIQDFYKFNTNNHTLIDTIFL